MRGLYNRRRAIVQGELLTRQRSRNDDGTLDLQQYGLLWRCCCVSDRLVVRKAFWDPRWNSCSN